MAADQPVAALCALCKVVIEARERRMLQCTERNFLLEHVNAALPQLPLAICKKSGNCCAKELDKAIAGYNKYLLAKNALLQVVEVALNMPQAK